MHILLKRGARLDFCRHDGLDAVQAAIMGGSLRCLIALLDQYGMKLKTQPPPFNLAVADGHIAVARYLWLQKGCQIDQVSQLNAGYADSLTCAACWGSIAMLKWLRRIGCKRSNSSSISPMLGAAMNNKAEVIEYLVSIGEQVDEADPSGRTYVCDCLCLVVFVLIAQATHGCCFLPQHKCGG